MANIRDVARLAGVSISSVSNLLNNRSHQMSAQTRERIEQVMATRVSAGPGGGVARTAGQDHRPAAAVDRQPELSALAHAVDGAGSPLPRLARQRLPP